MGPPPGKISSWPTGWGVAAYFIKPVNVEELSAQARMIREFFERSKLYKPA